MKAAVAHLSAAVVVATLLLGGAPLVLAGTAAFIGPLAARLALRDEFARRHAAAALRFNLSVALYTGAIWAAAALIAIGPYTVQVIPFLVLASLLVTLNWVLFTAVAVHRAATGQSFTYPMTIRGI
jgi:uncharacterized Tic20 family protein